jgi:hypothetical protein
MVWLGPLGPWVPLEDPLDALTPADVDWLERMADVLPRSMPVAGTRLWRDTRPFVSWITTETVRG